MRILYGIAGEGMGHATRSKAVLDELIKEYDVCIFSESKIQGYMKSFFRNVRKISTWRIMYWDNTVQNVWSFLWNACVLPVHVYSVIKILWRIHRFNPQVIISDFATGANYAALLSGKPLISLCNNTMVVNGMVDFPKGYFLTYLKVFLTVKLLCPKADYYVVPTFFSPPKRMSNAVFTSPVLRKEVLKLRPTTGKHILVYQTSKTNTRLLECLKKINEKCIIYGFSDGLSEGNLEFKPLLGADFFDDLASCKAVITNGGFSLISEALYLKKPVLSIPIEGQFEQLLNAFYVDKLGYGLFTRGASVETIKFFLSKLSSFRTALRRYPHQNNDLFFRQLRKVIAQNSAKKEKWF